MLRFVLCAVAFVDVEFGGKFLYRCGGEGKGVERRCYEFNLFFRSRIKQKIESLSRFYYELGFVLLEFFGHFLCKNSFLGV